MGSPGDRARFEELTAQLGGARQLLSDGRPAEAAEVLQRLAPVLPEAAVAYVACLRHGIGIPEGPQPVAAWHILEPLADAEYTPAMLAAALWLRNTYFLDGVLDDSIAKDDARSVRLLERMLDLEPRNRVALCALGVARHNGKGCVEDAHAGLQLCLAAAELGEPEAVCWVGKWMLSHRRAIQDRAARQVARGELEVLLRGKHLVHIAADAGVAYAHHVLADLYRDKDTLPSLLPKGAARGSQKLAEIADWHDMRGAELGAPIGYLNIGEGFSSGAGARGADFDAACMWYETAVSLGVRSGADALGFHYEKGSDGNAVDRIDLNAAVAWYHKGYELRHASATLHLAEAYDDGIGVEADHVRAEELYVKAKEYAQLDDAESVLEEASEDLIRLYAARTFLDMAPERYVDKLEALVGASKAKSLRLNVEALLQKLAAPKPQARRVAKVLASDAIGVDVLVSVDDELRKLVGDGSAERLLEAFRDKS